jgi:hypothetical protein
MYGAKAEQIAKVAFATWAPSNSKFESWRERIVAGVHKVCEDQTTTKDDLDEIEGFPATLKTDQFVKLARALAVNPLVA